MCNYAFQRRAALAGSFSLLTFSFRWTQIEIPGSSATRLTPSHRIFGLHIRYWVAHRWQRLPGNDVQSSNWTRSWRMSPQWMFLPFMQKRRCLPQLRTNLQVLSFVNGYSFSQNFSTILWQAVIFQLHLHERLGRTWLLQFRKLQQLKLIVPSKKINRCCIKKNSKFYLQVALMVLVFCWLLVKDEFKWMNKIAAAIRDCKSYFASSCDHSTFPQWEI